MPPVQDWIYPVVPSDTCVLLSSQFGNCNDKPASTQCHIISSFGHLNQYWKPYRTSKDKKNCSMILWWYPPCSTPIPYLQEKFCFLVLVSPMVNPKPRIYINPDFFRISQRSQNCPSSFFRGRILKWMKPSYPISTGSKPRSVAPVMISYVCWFINRIKYLLSEVPVGFTEPRA